MIGTLLIGNLSPHGGCVWVARSEGESLVLMSKRQDARLARGVTRSARSAASQRTGDRPRAVQSHHTRSRPTPTWPWSRSSRGPTRIEAFALTRSDPLVRGGQRAGSGSGGPGVRGSPSKSSWMVWGWLWALQVIWLRQVQAEGVKIFVGRIGRRVPGAKRSVPQRGRGALSARRNCHTQSGHRIGGS